MSHLTYTNYEGFREIAKKETHYSQAVRIGDIMQISGQGMCLYIGNLQLEQKLNSK
jgi:enamine deaminase RidA (YjgF/YER057c/UK114 family)